MSGGEGLDQERDRVEEEDQEICGSSAVEMKKRICS